MVKKRFDVEVPDGQHLGFSRDNDGARRAHLFDNETNHLVGHAELFDPDEEADEEADLEALAGALGAMVALAVIVAAAPHIKGWWNDKAVPAITSTRNRIRYAWNGITRPREADDEVIAAELVTVSDPSPDDSSNEVDTALERLRARMSSAEARQRFVAALMAKTFFEEQMSTLRNARIEDDEDPMELKSAMKALTPQQVGNTINLMLEKDPSLLSRENWLS